MSISGTMVSWLPSCLIIIDGKTADITATRALRLTKASIVVMDRSCTDYAWYGQLHTHDLVFVTRLRKCACFRVTERRPIRFRRFVFRDPETAKHYQFLTTHFGLTSASIA